MGREVLSSAPWDLVIGHMGMIQSCTRGGLNWTLEAFLYLEEDQTLEEASSRDGRWPKPDSVLKAFGQCP